MRLVCFLFNWLVKITGYLPSLFFIRFKTYYEDKKRQSRRIKGKGIIIANHRSVYDFALMMFLFPTRSLRCVVADILFNKNLPLRLFLRALGSIKVEREAHDFTFIGKCKKILDKGGVVEIYPEARINGDPDVDLLDFKPSAVYLALESGAPIIPVYTNAQYFQKKPSRVIIGVPVNVRALYDDSITDKENITKINDLLRGKILELKHELERKEKEEAEAGK